MAWTRHRALGDHPSNRTGCTDHTARTPATSAAAAHVAMRRPGAAATRGQRAPARSRAPSRTDAAPTPAATMTNGAIQIARRGVSMNGLVAISRAVASPVASSSTPTRGLEPWPGTAAPTTTSAHRTPFAQLGCLKCQSSQTSNGCRSSEREAATAYSPSTTRVACTPWMPSAAMIGAYRTPVPARATTDQTAVLTAKGPTAARPPSRQRTKSIQATAVRAGSTISGMVKKPRATAAAHVAHSALPSGLRTSTRPHSSAAMKRSSRIVYPLATVAYSTSMGDMPVKAVANTAAVGPYSCRANHHSAGRRRQNDKNAGCRRTTRLVPPNRYATRSRSVCSTWLFGSSYEAAIAARG